MTDETPSALTFPCDFPIKVVGLASADFQKNIVTLVHEVLPNFSETQIQTRLSGGGKYLALTLTVHVENKDTLDNIYRKLSASPLVLMAL